MRPPPGAMHPLDASASVLILRVKGGGSWRSDEAENGAESKHESVRRVGVKGKRMIVFDKMCQIFPCRTIGVLLCIW